MAFIILFLAVSSFAQTIEVGTYNIKWFGRNPEKTDMGAASQIKPKNRVEFESKEKAVGAGYRPARIGTGRNLIPSRTNCIEMTQCVAINLFNGPRIAKGD